MIPFLETSRAGESAETESRLAVSWGSAWELDRPESGMGSFLGDGNIKKLDGSDGCTNLSIC